jgi:hypothetical protein
MNKTTAYCVPIIAPLFSCYAQEFTSEPVGREILTVESGFNYLGLRMHQKIVVTSSYASVTNGSTTIGVHGDVVDALTAGTAYLFEVESGTALGAVIPVISFDTVNGTLTLNDDVSGSFQNGDRFSIRPASTLASVFGINNSAGLGSSGSSVGSDQVWLPDGAGDYEKYAYLQPGFGGSPPARWAHIDDPSTPIDPATVAIYYPDGLVMKGNSTVNSFKVSGVIKKTPTSYYLGQQFNYMSTNASAGATLETMFGADNDSGLGGAAGSSGADLVMIPDGLGGFDTYYYSTGFFGTPPEWKRLNSDNTSTPIDPSTISFESSSGFVIENRSANNTVLLGVPDFYSNL